MIEGAPGRFVGDRYHIVRELGRGGMGVVYLGRDLRLDMDVAIKFRGVTHSRRDRCGSSASSARSPRCATPTSSSSTSWSPTTRPCYFTMEYLAGVDPRRWVERPHGAAALRRSRRSTAGLGPDHAQRAADAGGSDRDDREPGGRGDLACGAAHRHPTVDFTRVRSVLAQLAEGLVFLHARGVIHRDVKPSNAIVVDGTVKLLDFGLALDRERRDDELARESRIVGTAAYLAPEYVERLGSARTWTSTRSACWRSSCAPASPPFGGTLHVLSRLRTRTSRSRARARSTRRSRPTSTR